MVDLVGNELNLTLRTEVVQHFHLRFAQDCARGIVRGIDQNEFRVAIDELLNFVQVDLKTVLRP